jgi:LruC domain-containing protein
MQRKLPKLGTLALACGLLTGYTTQDGRIDWMYFGTPLATHPYNPANGAPTNQQFTRSLPAGLPPLPADLPSKIGFTLPEGRDIRLNAQGLVPDGDDKTNIRFAEEADVWVSFLREGAGYRNSVGYFSYDPASPPTSPAQVQERIVFVNASMPSPLDAAGIYQNTVYLGRFAPGQAIGFVIVSDGFSSTGRLYNGTRIGGVKDNASPGWIFYTLRGLNPERPGPQNLNVHSIMLKDVSDASEGYQRVVIGFEDINREFGGDHDFNDVVLAVHVTPRRSIQNLDTLATLVAADDLDSDGDGVKDALDEFPTDARRAFSRHYPGADAWGTLAFEDQWPQRGDYDMNDVVMRYRTREIMNAQRQVVALDIHYQLQARGGLADSGFGLHLPGVPVAAVASASLQAAQGPAQPVGVEAGQTEATFIVTPSVHAPMPISADAGCSFANTRAGCPTIDAAPYRLQVDFATPQASTLFLSPFNPFIFRSSRRGQEVHLPGRPATARADRALFGSGDDRTPASGSGSTTYMDAQRRPWALDIPVAWHWPLEVTDLLRPYPRFADWAQSSGANARDWYVNGIATQHLAPQRP